MSRHEIEIDGLPEGWEPVKLVVRLPATAVDASYECVSSQELVIRRKVRKYDWSKTLDDVLIGFTEGLRFISLYKLTRLTHCACE